MLRAVRKLVIEHGGALKIVNETEYMKLVRNEHFLNMPKLIGKLDPADKSTIEWVDGKGRAEVIQATPIEEPKPKRDPVKLNLTQKAVLTNMILSNVDFLANKGVNNFVNNFDELILKRI